MSKGIALMEENTKNNSSPAKEGNFQKGFHVVIDGIKKPFRKISDFMRNHPLVSYSLRRIGSALLTIVLVIIATFFLLRMLPLETYYGSFIQKFPIASRPAIIQAVLTKLGLNKPVLEQLFNYFYQILPFIPKEVCSNEVWDVSQSIFVCSETTTVFVNFGTSFTIYPGANVLPILAEQMPKSFIVGIGAAFVEILIGYPLGIMMAKYHDKVPDRIGNIFIVIISSIPPIVYYYTIYLILLVNYINWGIPFQYVPGNNFSLIPPMIIVGIAGAADISLWVRRFMVDELNADYVKFARAKGLSENTILFKHVFRNALVPFIRTIPAAFLFSLMGSYFVERVFLIPGIGDMLITAIQRQDNTFVQALVIIFAFISTAAYLLGDLITVLFDPRVALIAKKGD
jgi:oligopeptide transport system permease protein